MSERTSGKSYRSQKYSLDSIERSSIDYGNNNIVWKKNAETIHYTNYINLWEKHTRILMHKDQIFSYFLDGSRHAYKIDDIAYYDGTRSPVYPIIAGQVGVGCCVRINKTIKPLKFQRELIISMPDISNAGGKPGFFACLLNEINEIQEIKHNDLKFSDILPYKTSKDEKQYSDRGVACIQNRMSENERRLVAELVRHGRLNQDNYLIKDGSLEYNPSKKDSNDQKSYQTFKNNYAWVLGVSKNFNPEICIDNHGKANPGFIADLPLFHRTPVSCYENPLLGDIQFAIWYIRIRDHKRTLSQFDGIIKVEKILSDSYDVIDSELVDLLSANLINERNPVCYGSDSRWANHLYPIYLTESYVKSKYLSSECFMHLF